MKQKNSQTETPKKKREVEVFNEWHKTKSKKKKKLAEVQVESPKNKGKVFREIDNNKRTKKIFTCVKNPREKEKSGGKKKIEIKPKTKKAKKHEFTRHPSCPTEFLKKK